MLRPEAFQFVIDELLQCGFPLKAARHRYGCRILQRLVESCPRRQIADLIDALIREAPSFACHPYGNYVIQHILKYGSDGQRGALCRCFCDNLRDLSANRFGSTVLKSVAQFCTPTDQDSLATGAP
ncbi:unnamed protein product [Polarella glacialis]|uniref:PUM-HD domain-containing protein n=1 Tax=Polarella glacialis TaxID=89957 RepID=A0A813KP25_POLGL|nr:unnamed protein product [Polarella glacialis]